MLIFTSSLIYVVSGTINNTNHESTVIVLGCAVHGDRPSRPLYQRINRAYKYLEENENAVAILSGGQGADDHSGRGCIEPHRPSVRQGCRRV